MTWGRSPRFHLFGVDDHHAQLTWRHQPPGELCFTVRHEPSLPPVVVATDGGPGSVTLGALPAGRLLFVDITGTGVGADPVTVPVRTLATLPGEELCRVATISDLHLGARAFGFRHTMVEDPAPEVPHPLRCTRAAVAEARAWGAERLHAKGDLTNGGGVDQWRAYAALVAEAGVPVLALPGNHDQDHPGYPPGPAARDAAEVFGLAIADPVLVDDRPGLRTVLVDSTLPGRNTGSVAAARDALLTAAAEADPAGGVLVLLHHQLQSQPVSEGWPLGIPHAESLALCEDLARVHPHVLISSGHTHRHRRWAHAGVTATQVGSTKDHPGVWAGYVVHEGGIRQTVHRVARPDVLAWTDHTRWAAWGLWGPTSLGRLDSRCFNLWWWDRAR